MKNDNYLNILSVLLGLEYTSGSSISIHQPVYCGIITVLVLSTIAL